ncbi:hypothetical protein [Paenibacillus bouchesdurhonensis]|uniref:hypothetical protein n=1 Tax=Paenibacillus bouchesdurhonensis TaxID=1870990 RepID=UPI000DA5ED92|nr:hypothetical protein [Paenibacillus bouchesdurhonensis]
MENEVIQNASHSVENTQDAASHSSEKEEIKRHYEAFNLPYPEDEDPGETDSVEDEADPAIDSESEQEQEPKGITVKHNGQEVTVEDEQVPEYLQMGLNYKKVKGQAQQYEAALDRIAKQQGYKDYSDLIANLDTIEQQRVQQQQDQFAQLRQQLRDEAENAGIDPTVMDQYLDSHPLLKQAQEVIQRSEQEQQLRQQEQSKQRAVQGWEDLFRKYPQLAEQVEAETGAAPWMTPEMQARIQRGYDPIDAYELVHRDTLLADERKRAEQSTLKQQRLNKRAHVEKAGGAELEPSAPEELLSAFALFELDPKNANKYAKNFEK